jgi:outer membrane receptor protein involved in Fe transport
VGTIQRATGTFRNDVIQRRQLNVDVIGTYFWNVNSDFNVDFLAGWNFNRRVFELDRIDGEDFVVPELFVPSNTLTSASDRDFTEQKLFGVYGQAVMSYKDWLTLTLTARNDWSSTLPSSDNSYFYPSASLAWVFTDALGISGNVLSYGKFRASLAQVGNDGAPYQLLFRFFPATVATGQYSLNLNFPFQGQSGFNKTNTIPNAALVPEEQTSYEFGVELQFFEGRLGLDMAYFNSENKNQILNVPIPETTGFAQRTVNVGQVTQEGVEITLNADVVRSSNFNWSTTVNFSHVESIVDELTEGTDRVIIASAFNSVQLVAVPGKEFQLFGIPWEREPTTGRPVINEADGTRIPGIARTYGSVFPDFTMGTNNTFSYKGLALNVTVDWSNGGLLRSATVENLWTGGFTDETVRNREGTFIDTEGVIVNDDGTFRDNDVPLRSAADLWQSLDDNSISEPPVFDATYVKLREVGLSYTLPANLFTNSFVSGVQVGVEGRNLALLYTKVPHIDPEASLFGAGADGFGIERSGVPSTRGIGFNVRVTF